MRNIKQRITYLKYNKNSGFTLVELLVVMAILAVIALVAAPSITNYVERARRAVNEKAAMEVHKAARLASDLDKLWPFTSTSKYSFHVNSSDAEINRFMNTMKGYVTIADTDLEDFTIKPYHYSPVRSLKIYKEFSDGKSRVEVTDSEGGFEVRYKIKDSNGNWKQVENKTLRPKEE